MLNFFPFRKTVLVALLGIVFIISLAPVFLRTVAVSSLDQRVYQFTQDYSGSLFTQAMKIATYLGGGEIFFILGILFCLGVFFYLGPRSFLLIFIGLFFTRLTTWILKESVERVRPISSVSFAEGFSFPSGHAVNIAFLTVIFYWFTEQITTRSKIKKIFFFVFLILAIVVGISRIFLQVHWASDVVGGLLLGLCLGLLIREWGNRFRTI